MVVCSPHVPGTLRAVLVVLAVLPTRSLPVSSRALAALRQQPQERLSEAAVYLKKYGWLHLLTDPTSDKSGSLVSLSDTLAEFQRFAGLPASGVMDKATMSKMHEPRCGVPDRQVPVQLQHRMQRYQEHGSRWRKRDLTFKIQNWPNITDRDGVRKAIVDAFKVWSSVSPLTFQEAEHEVDIDIRFETGDHGDGDPFDGPNGTLAHAFFPIFGGDTHFDNTEAWSVGPYQNRGIDLFTVAAHEFGHSLGLKHTEVKPALMNAFYRPPSMDGKFVWKDDIDGIQTLYGVHPDQLLPDDGAEKEDEDEEEGEDSILCRDSSVDAMLTATLNGKKRTFAFRGDYYWRLTDVGVEMGYPKKIRDRWGGVPGNLDAVLAYTPHSSSLNAKELLFFFKGSQVWRMTNVPNVDTGYPMAISDEFEGIPDDIDAAFTWSRNNKIYFFKGRQYWKFDYALAKAGIQAVSDQYPKDISVWKGVPSSLDSVITWKNGKTYFFKGDSYYKLDDQSLKVSTTPRYPRNIDVYWFGCSRRRTSGLMKPESQRRGDIAAEDSYGNAAAGFEDGDARSRQDGSGAAGLLPSLLLLLLLLLPAALATLHSGSGCRRS